MRKAAGLVARSKSARARSTDNASTEQEATGEGAVESVMVRNGRGHGEAARGDSFAIGAELAFWSRGSLTRKKAFAQSDIGLRGRAAAGSPMREMARNSRCSANAIKICAVSWLLFVAGILRAKEIGESGSESRPGSAPCSMSAVTASETPLVRAAKRGALPRMLAQGRGALSGARCCASAPKKWSHVNPLAGAPWRSMIRSEGAFLALPAQFMSSCPMSVLGARSAHGIAAQMISMASKRKGFMWFALANAI